MRFSPYLLFSYSGINCNSTPIKYLHSIKNIDFPSCKNCIHFSQDNYNIDSLSLCTKFGEKNIITDEINHDFANSCRKDEEKCGLEGKCFERETDMNLRYKQMKYFLSKNSTNIFILSFFSIYTISYIYILRLKYTS